MLASVQQCHSLLTEVEWILLDPLQLTYHIVRWLPVVPNHCLIRRYYTHLHMGYEQVQLLMYHFNIISSGYHIPADQTYLTAPKQLFSQAAFPVISPPASKILVTSVASTLGTQSTAPVPFVHCTPARAMLSFNVTVMPSNSLLTGLVDLTVAFQAQPPLSVFSPSGL